mmetsp:Transcript_31787/g.48751  ORF Transcript_31787/g.48751 Transcript_31787/m.48751 type:complete len:323 (-) Transcript_31787:74-1042(-)
MEFRALHRILIAGVVLISTTEAFSSVPRAIHGSFPPAVASECVRSEAAPPTKIFARGRDIYPDDDDDFDFDDDDEFYYDDDEAEIQRPRGRRRRRPVSADDLGDTNGLDGELDLPSPFGRREGWRLPESVSKALLAGVFVLGIGLGVTVDSAINTNPKDLASRDAVDQAAPNAQICATYGASAMAFDQRVFVSFNPFNVYVAQADVKPACVLRPSNVVPILKDTEHLLNDNEIRSCKANMNTWAFVGDLDSKPQLSCVYKSADAQNEFLSNPKLGIGEDVYDDDREKAIKAATGKLVKGEGLTDAQKKEILRRQSLGVSGLD